MGKTSITKREYHALCGLMVLAKRHTTALKEIERAAAELCGDVMDDTGYAGHVTDEIYDTNPDADKLLSHMEITVEDES